jgi:hypothetical protein
MLNVIILSVIMLNGMAPNLLRQLLLKYTFSAHGLDQCLLVKNHITKRHFDNAANAISCQHNDTQYCGLN